VDFLYIDSGYTGNPPNCEHRQRVSDWNTSKPGWPVKDPDGDGWASDGAFADGCPEEANVDKKDPGDDGTCDVCSTVDPPPPSAGDGDGVEDALDNSLVQGGAAEFTRIALTRLGGVLPPFSHPSSRFTTRSSSRFGRGKRSMLLGWSGT
jgi:hypothetical protein